MTFFWLGVGWERGAEGRRQLKGRSIHWRKGLLRVGDTQARPGSGLQTATAQTAGTRR